MWSAALAFATGVFVTLVVPFWFPVAPIEAVSIAYRTGFNTRAADLGALGVMGTVLWLAWRGRFGTLETVSGDELRQRMSPRFIATTMFVLLGALSLACWVVDFAQVRWQSDAGYFREQMQSLLFDHRQLYTGLEFPYGPMLMWLPVGAYLLLHPLGASITDAYFVSLVLAQALGLLTLAFVLNRLPIRSNLRRAGFILIASGSCVSLLGMNYTLFRFLPPLLILLLVPQVRRKAAVVGLLTAGAVVEMLISPEVGAAFVAACWCYGLLRCSEDRWYAVAEMLLPAGAAAATLLVLHSYLDFLITFSRGAFNLPLVPVPPILIFLFAFTWLVPRCIGILLREHGRLKQETPVHAAMCAYGVGMLPSTFARCDPLHVFFNGSAVLVLSLMAASRMSRRAGAVWVGCLAVLVLWMQAVNLRVDAPQIWQTATAALQRMPASERNGILRCLARIAPGYAQRLGVDAPGRSLDVAQFERFVGTATVATPVEIEWPVEQELRRTGHFRSDYYSFSAVFSRAAEQRKVQELDETQWALIPLFSGGIGAEDIAQIGLLQGVQFPYPARHPILYLHNQLIFDELRTQWHPVADIDGYRLFAHAPASRGH